MFKKFERFKLKYLYFGQLIDIKKRNIGINDKKIGITNDLKIREKKLSRTKSPINFLIIHAWEIEKEKCKIIKSIIHKNFEYKKTDGEFFEDVDHGDDLLEELRWF